MSSLQPGSGRNSSKDLHRNKQSKANSHQKRANPNETLALTAITSSSSSSSVQQSADTFNAAFTRELDDLQRLTDAHNGTGAAIPPSMPYVDLMNSPDPFAIASSSASSFSPIDSLSSLSLPSDTPTDIMLYYTSSREVRRQILTQSVSAVKFFCSVWSSLASAARVAQATKQRVGKAQKVKEGIGGGRQSTLAQSYMSMVAAAAVAEAEKEKEGAEKEKAMQQEEIKEETDVDALEQENEQKVAENTTSDPTPSPSSSSTTKPSITVTITTPSHSAQQSHRPTSSSTSRSTPRVGLSDLERAVQSAHQTKLAKAEEESARVKAEQEMMRTQAGIQAAQARLEATEGQVSGETPYIRLQEDSILISTQPIRVGIIGGGKIGLALAESILEECCGLMKPTKTDFSYLSLTAQSITAPPVRNMRVFLSTRRPDSSSLASLVARTSSGGAGGGGSGGALLGPQGTYGSGRLFTVYWDNARLLTECNIVLLAVLPHQLQSVADTLRGVKEECRPRSQLIFSLTATPDLKALKHLLGTNHGAGNENGKQQQKKKKSTVGTGTAFDSSATAASTISRTQLILPHLLSKSSPQALLKKKEFIDSLCQAMQHAMKWQNGFKFHLMNGTSEGGGSNTGLNDEKNLSGGMKNEIDTIILSKRADLEEAVSDSFELPPPPPVIDPHTTPTIKSGSRPGSSTHQRASEKLQLQKQKRGSINDNLKQQQQQAPNTPKTADAKIRQAGLNAATPITPSRKATTAATISPYITDNNILHFPPLIDRERDLALNLRPWTVETSKSD